MGPWAHTLLFLGNTLPSIEQTYMYNCILTLDFTYFPLFTLQPAPLFQKIEPSLMAELKKKFAGKQVPHVEVCRPTVLTVSFQSGLDLVIQHFHLNCEFPGSNIPFILLFKLSRYPSTNKMIQVCTLSFMQLCFNHLFPLLIPSRLMHF